MPVGQWRAIRASTGVVKEGILADGGVGLRGSLLPAVWAGHERRQTRRHRQDPMPVYFGGHGNAARRARRRVARASCRVGLVLRLCMYGRKEA